MKNTITLLLIVISVVSFGQNNYFSIPEYDCNNTSINKITETGEIVFVFPNSSDSLVYLEWTSLTRERASNFSINVLVRFEHELTENDFEKSMIIVGIINDFKNWERFEVPILKQTNGFEFGEMTFQLPEQSMFYISDTSASAMRMVMTGNSLASLQHVTNYPRAGYCYSIFEKGIITYFGNCTNGYFDKSKHVDLTYLKNTHYRKIKTSYYNFHISLRLEDQIDSFKTKLDSFDLFVEDIVRFFEIPKPSYRIPCFIHFDQEEISYISTHFDHACEGKTWGVLNLNEIHSKGFNGAIEHETAHILFNSEYNNFMLTFFSEGIVKYYEMIKYPEQLAYGIATAIKYSDEDLIPVILGLENFFQGSKYYNISGVFVKYLIDRWGLEKFKQFYRADNIEIGFKDTFNVDLSYSLEGYREWLKQK